VWPRVFGTMEILEILEILETLGATLHT
jgi:hypothetical protein